MSAAPVLLSAAVPEARRLISQGQRGAALNLLRDALQQDPDHAEANFLAAVCLRQLARLAEAQEHARRAVRSQPSAAPYRSLAGDLAEELGQLGEAEKLYGEALQLDTHQHTAWHGLGAVHFRKQNLPAACQCFQRAVELQPAAANYRINLATSLFRAGQHEACLPHLQSALQAQPESLLAWRLLGQVRAQLGDLSGAEKCFVKALEIAPRDGESSLHLGSIFHLRGEYAHALEASRHAVECDPKNNHYRITYGELLCKCGEVDAGRQVLAAALQSDPRNLKIRVAGTLALPGVYESLAHLEKSRSDYARGLENLLTNAAEYAALPQPSIIAGLGWSNFLLAYQGDNDLVLQKKYAAFQKAILEPNAPKLYQPRNTRTATNRRIRVGFVSSFFFDHTVGWYFQSWITGLSREGFEIHVYHLNPGFDWLTAKIRERADKLLFASGMPTFAIAQVIVEDQLDVLIYPELGMCPTSFLLAGMRLAPLQASGWGHPVTSGHANMDIRFTPEIMEPDNADVHYSEKLIRLPSLGTRYEPPPSVAPKPRADIGLPESDSLLVVPQSIFKIHPANDALYVQLLRQLPGARLLFFEDLFPRNTEKFKQRLGQQLNDANIDANRCTYLPRMGRDNFREVLAAADVMLDTLHWSGGNTSLDALAANLPIVTLPGGFMRGRQSAGMLRMLELDSELVAESEADYVNKVRALIDDSAKRKILRQLIEERKNRLFGNDEAIVALQATLRSLVVHPPGAA